MNRMPTLAAIDAAELRLVQSRLNVRQSVDRTRTALRTAITRPSTLLLVALASGVSVYLFSPRVRPPVKNVAHSAQSAGSTESTRSPEASDSPNQTSKSLLRTFVSMYGVRVLTLALQLGAAAGKQRKQNGSRVDANPPGTSAKGTSTST